MTARQAHKIAIEKRKQRCAFDVPSGIIRAPRGCLSEKPFFDPTCTSVRPFAYVCLVSFLISAVRLTNEIRRTGSARVCVCVTAM